MSLVLQICVLYTLTASATIVIFISTISSGRIKSLARRWCETENERNKNNSAKPEPCTLRQIFTLEWTSFRRNVNNLADNNIFCCEVFLFIHTTMAWTVVVVVVVVIVHHKFYLSALTIPHFEANFFLRYLYKVCLCRYCCCFYPLGCYF